MRQQQAPAVLLVEDDYDDRALFEVSVRKTGARISLHVAENGAEAIRYLEGDGEYADRTTYPIPSLIVLDLKMDGMGGLEFLSWRHDTPFTAIPVIILEGSGNESDHKRALAFGALSIFVKPVQFDRLYGIVRQMMQLMGVAVDEQRLEV